MADAYGEWAGSYGRWRCHINYGIQSENDSSAVVYCQTRFNTNRWNFDVYGSDYVTVNGSTRNTNLATHYSANLESVDTIMIAHSQTIYKGTSAQNIGVSGRVQITGGYQNGTSSASGSVWVSAAPAPAPPPVTVPGTPAVRATRSSDTSISVVWQLTQPTHGSITSNCIEVKIDEGNWTTISDSLSGSATSYTYSSSSANHRYQFRVASSSSAGQSNYGVSGYVYTTPAAPRGGYGLIRGTNVGVTALIDNINYPSSYEWQRSANGSTGWTNINGAQSSISDTYSGSTAPYYRVKCVGMGGLASAYSPAFRVSKGYNIYVNSAEPTPDKINFYVPPGSSIKSIKILV